MRIETITRTVYTLSELSAKAQENAYTKWLQDGVFWSWESEVGDTIKKLEKLLSISIVDWCYGGGAPSWKVRFHLSDEVLNLAGARAMAWFWNNCGRVLTEAKTRYFGNGRKYTSKVFESRCYDGTCPLTGFIIDNDALNPIAEFCFGVVYDEKAGKRIQTSRKWKPTETVCDIINECVSSLFNAISDNYEEAQSFNQFKEDCEANGWEFTEAGEFAVAYPQLS